MCAIMLFCIVLTHSSWLFFVKSEVSGTFVFVLEYEYVQYNLLAAFISSHGTHVYVTDDTRLSYIYSYVVCHWFKYNNRDINNVDHIRTYYHNI
jgi:hypothetical protein